MFIIKHSYRAIFFLPALIVATGCSSIMMNNNNNAVKLTANQRRINEYNLEANNNAVSKPAGNQNPVNAHNLEKNDNVVSKPFIDMRVKPDDFVKYKSAADYGLIKTKNAVKDKKHTLDPFFRKLFLLRKLRNDGEPVGTATVVHIGDSHIQADITTATTRRLMQKNFGNAGRGLIAPLKLAKTGGGYNYKITSDDVVWNVSRVTKSGEIPVGVAGFGLQSNNSVVRLSIETDGEWAFDKVTAFYDRNKSNAYPENILHNPIVGRYASNDYAESFKLKNLVNSLDIEFSSEYYNEITIFGFNLTNGKNGVLYDAVGVNGAHFFNYKSETLFCKQISHLNPDLIIVSLGTNEAYARNLNEENLYHDISDFVFNLRHESPDAVVILTTPAETLKRYAKNKRAPNQTVKRVRDVIVKYAEANNCAYWDLYEITGGKDSALKWDIKNLLAKDGVHFTHKGYEYVGELLFEALSEAYNDYLNYLKTKNVGI